MNTDPKKETVAILGASNKPDRYAYKALVSLIEAGHTVIPITPTVEEINGIKCLKQINDISATVDTVTLYVRPEISSTMTDAFIKLKPKRVIFNPGTENSALAEVLTASGINVIEACTLVMLRTKQF
jgi:predicted CoA-binding protein